MENGRQATSLFLVFTIILSTAGLDGCNKKSEVPAAQAAQPPQTTYAVPSADQLYQLVAPIALFPDNLVAQVLAGSTFPDQITAAYQWLQQNSGLKGQQLMQAADEQPWDASVKALTQFPDVLNQMASNLSWTSALGDAYYNVPQSVMNAVQVMRQRAYQAGNLKTTPQQNVSVQNEAPGGEPAAPASSGQPQTTIITPPAQTIVIQPAQPDVVYVPTYNPTVVYGAPVPAYPGYSTGDMVATGLISFGLGMAVGAAINGGGCCGWGWNSWGCGWHNSTVVYNRNVYVSNSNTFVNRNNYYNRNVNNINTNNINRNNFNSNNINRNNLNNNNVNRNNFNGNNRANNFGNNYSAPKFDQKYNQPQFRNENASNLAQNRGAQPNFNQQNLRQTGAGQQNRADLGQSRGGNLNQQNRGGLNQNQSRPSNFGQNERTPQRGYGDQPSRNAGNSAFGNYGEGGNARTNSARGQQSLEGRSGGGNFGGGGRSGGNAGGRSGGGRRR
jgi:hypothetical protein